ncbi:hypothetical protein [Nocardiopsis trehalosi]|jgi:hypothetical protein|uniref:hypothetical protein n=1 Tax=Nocardiopsis trehalosi TaxID=109329 RepID=UPI000AE275EE|nr:hypothetical protein [Nocardiopsis trehalosi]
MDSDARPARRGLGPWVAGLIGFVVGLLLSDIGLGIVLGVVFFAAAYAAERRRRP